MTVSRQHQHNRLFIFFVASNTGKFLQDVGLFDETVKYYHVANYIFEDVRDWTRESLPLHLAALKKAAGPALAKAEEAFNYVSKNVHKASIQIIDKVNNLSCIFSSN